MLKIFFIYTTILCLSYAQSPTFVCFPATLQYQIPKVTGSGSASVSNVETTGAGYSSILTSEIFGSGSASSRISTNEITEEVPTPIVASGSGSVSVITKELSEKTTKKPKNLQFIDEKPNFKVAFDTGDFKQHIQGTSRRFQNSNGTISIGEGQYGNYSYTGSDGKVRTVVFTSDENGYQPRFINN
ncbi:uncharacterized protein [Chironomus tepperi]|uniref:uncharacterized protein n=1 Tax=Chironomus tepperi TaxID=113505 RepID=UPI00391F7993